LKTPDDLQDELTRLQSALATRASTRNFAHAALAVVVALILASSAAKLFWDSVKVPYLGFLAAGIALGLALFAWVRARRALRQSQQEHEQFEQLQRLHEALGLNNPEGLLPNR
jgi:Flp pilus assembly protein TadB